MTSDPSRSIWRDILKKNMGDDVVFFILLFNPASSMSEQIDIETRLICISSFFSFDIIKTYCWYYYIKNDMEDFEFKSTTMMFKDEQGGGWRPFVAVLRWIIFFFFFVLLNAVVCCEKSQRDEIKPEGQMRSSSRHTRVIVNNFSETLIFFFFFFK